MVVISTRPHRFQRPLLVVVRSFSKDKNPDFRSKGQTWADKIDASPDGYVVYRLHKKDAGSDFTVEDGWGFPTSKGDGYSFADSSGS